MNYSFKDEFADLDSDRWFEEIMQERREALGEEPCPYPMRPRPALWPARLCREACECGCCVGVKP